jgi:hypothetical protein
MLLRVILPPLSGLLFLFSYGIASAQSLSRNYPPLF